MPRPSKRTLASRAPATPSDITRQRTATARKEIPDSCSEGGALSSSSTSGGEVEIDSEPDDDIFVLNQPEKGWKEAERQLKGLSRANAGKTPQSRWYYSHKQKEHYREKIQLQRAWRYRPAFQPATERANTAGTTDRCEKGKGCCALRVLEAEYDFQNEKSMLETIILEAGHEVTYLLSQVPMRAQLYWVLLGSCETIYLRALQILLPELEKTGRGYEFCRYKNNSALCRP